MNTGHEPRSRERSWKVPLVLLTSVVLLALSIHNIQQKSQFEILDDGVFWETRDGRVFAKHVDPRGPAAKAGVHVGDVLLLVGDIPVEDAMTVRSVLDASDDGEELHYQLLRENEQRALLLVVAPLPQGNVPAFYFLAAVGIFSLGVGTIVYVRRRGVAATAHFYLLCVFWFLAYGFSFTGELDGWDRAFFWMEVSGLLFFPAIFLHFALCFPRRHPIVRRRAWVLWAGYVPAAVLLYLNLTAELAFLSTFSWGGRFFSDVYGFVDRVLPVHVAIYSVLAFAAFVSSYGRARSVTVKKQTKWIVWGTGFGTLPFALFYAIPYAIGMTPNLLMELTVVPLALIPLSFAYAIVKYRLMDVEVLFKRGVVYTLATGAVGGLYLAIFLAGARYFVGDDHSTILALLSAIVIVMLFSPIKTRIQDGIDRLFYRERYDYRRALMAFSRDLNAHLDLDHLSERLVERISDTFEVEKVALLVPATTGEFRIQASNGLSAEESRWVSLEQSSRLHERLAAGEAIYSGEFEWESGAGLESLARLHQEGARDNGGASLAEGFQYAIPCRFQSKLVGIILLGRRWDQSALSTEDMQLLTMLSGQAATALENARLYRSLEQKAAEFATLKEHSENTIESLEAGIVVLDLDGHVVRWNRALETLYGLSRTEALGRAFSELFPDSVLTALEASIGTEWWRGEETSEISRLNLENVRGEDKVVKLQVAPFVSGTQAPEGSIVIFEDITLRVELETQLQLREKMSSLGLLAAGVAHEVNTPLTGISSFTQMMQEQTEGDDPRASLLEKIERQTERASKIVNNLLNFARQGRGEFVPVCLNDVVQDVLSLLEHQLTRARVQVRLELADEIPDVLGDENKLQQVFLNLVLNAQDAMPSGGWLSIRTTARGGTVLASVSDTGQGIGQEDIKRIYDPFFTTKRAGASGTGLGLSITYGIIQEHSGRIHVESSVGKGTSFELRFPVCESPQQIQSSSAGGNARSARRRS